MIMVSIGTFSWNSYPSLRRHPPAVSVVMVATVVVVVAAHDLSLGVLTGVLLSGIFFAGKVRRMFAVERSRVEDGGAVLYRVSGEIVFASVDRFTSAFDAEAGRPVIIDVSAAHFWDISGVGALDKIIARLRRSEEHPSELQSLMRISSAVFCLKKKTTRLHLQSNILTPQHINHIHRIHIFI